MSLPTVEASNGLPLTSEELEARLGPLGLDLDDVVSMQVVVAHDSGALFVQVTTLAHDPLGQPFMIFDELGREGRLATEVRLVPLAVIFG